MVILVVFNSFNVVKNLKKPDLLSVKSPHYTLLDSCKITVTVTEIFKMKMKLGPKIMKDVFEIVECLYSLRNELKFKSTNINAVRYGIETASVVDARVRNNLHSNIEECKSFELFESKIQK